MSGCFLKRTLKHFLEHLLIKNSTAVSTRVGCYVRHCELLLGNAKSRQTFPVRVSYQAQRSAPLICQKILDLTFKPVLPFQTHYINDHLFPILPCLCREKDTHTPNTICISLYPQLPSPTQFLTQPALFLLDFWVLFSSLPLCQSVYSDCPFHAPAVRAYKQA